MPIFHHDGLGFNYVDAGMGLPFVFQHGLGGDVNQPLEYYAPEPGVRLVALDCRGHGATYPLGSVAQLNFDTFAGDALALLDYLRLGRVVIGGISMGAGVALNLAVNHPEHVAALILARPAWLETPLPENLRVIVEIASLIEDRGPEAGLAVFQGSADYATLLREAPDTARSLAGQFTHPRAAETVAKLKRLPNDAPVRERDLWATIQVPTLVLATRVDPVHPFAFGTELAAAIPGASFQELTPKSIDRERHVQEMRMVISAFLCERLASEAGEGTGA